LRVHVGFDEARYDHRIFEAPVDRDLLVGDPTPHFVERANAEDLAVHHRHGLRGWRAGIEGDDGLGGVDGDLLRGRGRRGGLGSRGVDAVRLSCKFVIVCKCESRCHGENCGKQ
jgi:hypothetical protein